MPDEGTFEMQVQDVVQVRCSVELQVLANFQQCCFSHSAKYIKGHVNSGTCLFFC